MKNNLHEWVSAIEEARADMFPPSCLLCHQMFAEYLGISEDGSRLPLCSDCVEPSEDGKKLIWKEKSETT